MAVRQKGAVKGVRVLHPRSPLKISVVAFFFKILCFQLHLIHRVSSSWFHLICNSRLVIIKSHYIDVSLETVGVRSDWNISDMQRVFLWMFVFFCKTIKLSCEMCLCCLPVELMPGNIFLGLKLIHPNRFHPGASFMEEILVNTVVIHIYKAKL